MLCKWTLPLIRLREVMKKSDWEEVRVLLFEDLEEVRMRRLVDYLIEHSAVDRAVEEAEARIAKAKSYLAGISSSPALDGLHRLADDIVERNWKVLRKESAEKTVANSA